MKACSMARNISNIARLTSSRFKLPSISFSGAGFLGAYHAGVYASLLKHGYVLKPMEMIPKDEEKNDKYLNAPILTGVSAGALISAAIGAGVHPELCMNIVVQISEATRKKSGVLDVLTPGFSLIDQLEEPMRAEMRNSLGGSANGDKDDYDNDLLLNRIRNGKLLHIGLTDQRKFFTTENVGNLKQHLDSYVYADQYRNLDDVIAASILSSYIPFGTGPLSKKDKKNLAVQRAWNYVSDMERLGFLKSGTSGSPVGGSTCIDIEEESESNGSYQRENDSDEKKNELYYLDGGLSNMFPEIDDQTVIVTPVNGIYSNPSIAPNHNTDLEDSKYFSTITTKIIDQLKIPRHGEISERVHVGVNMENLKTAYLMAKSSTPELLHQKFYNGYDDSNKFLKDHSLLTVFSS
mmetsp:Transcript_28792/g.44020  ORF Transcript_28792/g.44020 Transcript_28792/m.44020 type:complete len:407 (+) Transcript_28792:37-1257(+)